MRILAGIFRWAAHAPWRVLLPVIMAGLVGVAPLGVAAMTQPAQQAWLDAIYDTVRASHNDYFGDTVTLLCLLVMSGNHLAV